MKIIEYYFKLFRTIVLPDRVYLKNKFIRNLGYQPNFKIPTSLNEKSMHVCYLIEIQFIRA